MMNMNFGYYIINAKYRIAADPLPRVIMRPYCDSKMLTRKFCREER